MVLYLGWRCSSSSSDDDDEKDKQNAEDNDYVDQEVVKKALTRDDDDVVNCPTQPTCIAHCDLCICQLFHNKSTMKI